MRRRYLIAYDIANEKRLRRVATLMESFGERLQYSVFMCDMTPGARARWRSAMLEEMQLGEDSVVVIDLGEPGSEDLTVIGVPRALPQSGATII